MSTGPWRRRPSSSVEAHPLYPEIRKMVYADVRPRWIVILLKVRFMVAFADGLPPLPSVRTIQRHVNRVPACELGDEAMARRWRRRTRQMTAEELSQLVAATKRHETSPLAAKVTASR